MVTACAIGNALLAGQYLRDVFGIFLQPHHLLVFEKATIMLQIHRQPLTFLALVQVYEQKSPHGGDAACRQCCIHVQPHHCQDKSMARTQTATAHRLPRHTGCERCCSQRDRGTNTNLRNMLRGCNGRQQHARTNSARRACKRVRTLA